MNLAQLLQQLDDVTAFSAADLSAQHMRSLCGQAAHAIRQLQAENSRAVVRAHIHFSRQMAEAYSRLADGMEGHG